MGFYRILVARLPCQRCGAAFEDNLQFYTGSDREMQVYLSGESAGDDPHLVPGSRFEAYAERYCSRCLARWQADQYRAFYEGLAGMVESKGVVVRRGDRVLTVGDLSAAPVPSGPFHSIPNFWAWLADEELVVLDAPDIGADREPSQRLVEGLHEAFDDLMREKGWPFGLDECRKDVRVVVTEDGVIVPELAEPRAP